MKVIKIGGGSLKGKREIAQILDLVAERGRGHVFVASALNGVTDQLLDGIPAALADDSKIPAVINRLKNRHLLVARHVIPNHAVLQDFTRNLSKTLSVLERYYYGLNFTQDITPRLRDAIASLGECLSVKLLTAALKGRGLKAAYRDPRGLGLMTDGKFGDATARLRQTSTNMQKNLTPLLDKQMILFVPGFFGVSEDGDVTTFGRGGSDYSAAVVAVALKAECLEVWKDVAGFMSADPKLVPGAHLIPSLSYDEAAELAYFGAKILHPRTLEPIRKGRIEIAVKNTMDPDAPGSMIVPRSRRTPGIIKSVSHDADVGLLKVYASAVGARPGILAGLAGRLNQSGINIKSVVTSQTCITMLLGLKDLEPGYEAIKSMSPKPFRNLEKIDDVALACIVGEGLFHNKGIAARCFAAVAESNVNVEMISFGPSKVALYFLVRQTDLRRAVNAIHKTFFDGTE